MKPPAFAYERPDSVAATVAALARHGEDAKLLAGGQSLIAMLNLRLIAPKTVIDAGRLRELDFIRADGNELVVGALTRHNTVMHSAAVARQCPLITDAYRFISHHAIRNRGTIGGNLCHADPASELPLVAILLEATLVLKSNAGERRVAAADFFKGPFETAARADELLTEVRFPAEPQGQGYAFDEVSQRHGDFAIVAAGCTLTVADGICQRVAARLCRRRPACGAGPGRRGRARQPAGNARKLRQGGRGRGGQRPADQRCPCRPSLPARPGAGAERARAGGGARALRLRQREMAMTKETVRVVVNGTAYERTVEPRLLLSDFLRDELGLTGTHVGCEHGVCGACTVLLDGKTARSCLMLAVQADGADSRHRRSRSAPPRPCTRSSRRSGRSTACNAASARPGC